MHIIIAKTNLVRILARTAPATSPKSTTPVLSCVLLTAADGKLSAVGTDVIMSVSTRCEAAVKSPGRVAIGAKALLDIAKKLPAGDVTLKLNDKGRLAVKAGKSNFLVPVVDADEFPAIPTVKEGTAALTVSSSVLSRLIVQTAYAQCTDDTRSHMTCIRLDYSSDTLTAVTTDGHRLALTHGEASFAGGTWENSLPTRGVNSVKSLCDEFADETCAIVAANTGYLHFTWPEVELTIKKSDDAFVPYRKVVPASHSHSARVHRAGLIACVERAVLVADGKSSGVRVQLSDGSIDIRAETDKGTAHEQLDVDYAGEGLTVGVNAAYLVEALKADHGEEVLFKLGGDLDPVVVEGANENPECKSVIMPCRI